MLVGINVLMVLESCHHQCLKALCGGFGLSQRFSFGALNGTLKLRHCTDLFTKRFLPWSLPRVGAPSSRALNAEEMEKVAHPFLRRRGRERWACLAIFFLALGLGDFALGDAWNLHSEATGVVGYRLDSPAEGTGAMATVRLISCTRALG